MNDYILTYTGRRMFLANPQPHMIDLADIAHALARIGRFTGHGDRFLSVAQHCVHVSKLCPLSRSRWGLLHDATEAYLGDVSTPLKRTLRGEGLACLYDGLQETWQLAISKRFQVQIADVKKWDIISLLTEVRDNGPRGEDPWTWFPGYEPDSRPIEPWTTDRAEAEYLDLARKLEIK